ncbi:DUF6192 family protein [Streptomyces europaeiscabiei]|uniref:DUF6192 family protein n=1 Tax=Streptomyces europaeiscabiei TaxID=146819 RepID=UPI002E17C3C6
MPTSTKVGSVSRARYEEIIAGDRELIEVDTKIQFVIGDHALEIEPMRPHGGSLPAGGEDLFGVRETLEMYAEDVGVPYNQVRLNRQTASRWPAEYRVQGVSFEIHRILEKLDDRFERITNPPRHPRDGVARWTQDAAKRQVGWRVDSPQSVQEKVEAIHDLAVDEQVAARVATDFLRRPGVAFRAAGDNTARHLFNTAQTSRWMQAEESDPVPGEPENPVAPAIRQIDRTIEFLDLIGACHKFVAATGRLVPQMHGRRLSEDERDLIHKNVARVRATCEWVESAVDSGHLDMDEELARILRGEGE